MDPGGSGLEFVAASKLLLLLRKVSLQSFSQVKKKTKLTHVFKVKGHDQVELPALWVSLSLSPVPQPEDGGSFSSLDSASVLLTQVRQSAEIHANRLM